VLTVVIPFFRPYDLMNRNGKRMKFEATCLTEAQRCEIAEFSKLNAPSKHALGREYEVGEGAIRKVWGNWENILQQNRAYRDIVEYESATNFRGFEAL
jgi:hypothetical protein